MFKYSLIFSFITLCSCSIDASEQKTNTTSNESIFEELDLSKLSSTDTGIKEITSKDFLRSLEKSCTVEKISTPENCLYYNKISNFDFTSVTLNEFSEKNNVTFKTNLELGPKNYDDEYSTKTLKLTTIIDGIEVDTIDIYNYKFDEYAYSERVFYINQNLELWLLDSVIFEGVLYIKSWKKFNIKPDTGKIINDNKVY